MQLNKQLNNNKIFYLFTVFFLFLGIADPVFAGAAQSLPWEEPMEKLQKSFHYVAYFIAFIALIVAGGMMAFGGELSEFGRKMINIVFAVAIISGGAGIMAQLFSGQSALM